MVNGEAGKIIENANAGLVCPAESPEALVKNILILQQMGTDEVSEMGQNARKYYDENFERSFLFEKAESIFDEMCLTYRGN
jgi:hypothetical protein